MSASSDAEKVKDWQTITLKAPVNLVFSPSRQNSSNKRSRPVQAGKAGVGRAKGR
jgi:hypothetical protein